LLDGPFVELAEGVAENLYSLWLGSGISLSRMPGLKEVAMAVLDHLQRRVEAGNAACPYRNSLERILDLGGFTPDERTRVDFTMAVATWPDIEASAGACCCTMLASWIRHRLASLPTTLSGKPWTLSAGTQIQPKRQRWNI
jgi:hypothetical protein